MEEIDGKTLLTIARSAIAKRVEATYSGSWGDAPWLHEQAATFVTLHKDGELRGCIGTLEAHQPLLDDVQHNAVSAAFRDPRFPPLTIGEFDLIDIEVSILTPPQPLEFSDEEDAISKLTPFEDGVILSCDPLRGTFLPQVWEQLPDPHQFMTHLKLKAGLPGHYWSDDIRLETYRVRKFSEKEADHAQ